MFSIRRASLATVILGLIAAVPAIAQPAPASGGRLGVVNVGKVFEQIQEAKDLRATLESKKSEYNSLGQKYQAEINNLKQQLANGPKPDTQQYDDLAQQIEQKGVQYENDLKLKQVSMARDLTHQLKSVYDKVEAAVADIAKTRGLDLVITEIHPEFPPNVRDLTPEAIQNLIGARNVLYKSDKIDITSEVITALDAKYKAGEK